LIFDLKDNGNDATRALLPFLFPLNRKSKI